MINGFGERTAAEIHGRSTLYQVHVGVIEVFVDYTRVIL